MYTSRTPLNDSTLIWQIYHHGFSYEALSQLLPPLSLHENARDREDRVRNVCVPNILREYANLHISLAQSFYSFEDVPEAMFRDMLTYTFLLGGFYWDFVDGEPQLWCPTDVLAKNPDETFLQNNLIAVTQEKSRIRGKDILIPVSPIASALPYLIHYIQKLSVHNISVMLTLFPMLVQTGVVNTVRSADNIVLFSPKNIINVPMADSSVHWLESEGKVQELEFQILKEMWAQVRREFQITQIEQYLN